MRTRGLSVLTATLAAILVAAAFSWGRGSPTDGAAAASASRASTPGTMSAFYLDVGASASIGFQPTGVVHHEAERTATGYANGVVFREALRGVDLSLTEIGCAAETLQTMVSKTLGDKCYHLPHTQLTAAETFLAEHRGEKGLVTLDMGFNNMRICLTPTPRAPGCVNHAVALARADVPRVVRDLEAAAGAHVEFVGLEYADPYLGRYLDGADGPSVAATTLAAMNEMNAALAAAYRSAGARVANVPARFDSNVTKMLIVPNVGSIPENVAVACEYTWFCVGKPFGPDDHPNNAGYSQIAAAITATLPRRW